MTRTQGDDIGRVAEQLTLRQQATRMMVDTHVFNAQTHFKNGQLELALSDLEAALSLDDTNLEAQSLYAQVQSLMGHTPSTQKTLGEAMGEQHQLRVQQLLGQARDFYNKGQLALSRKDYDTAVAELGLAVSSVRAAPFALDWDGLDTRAEELLQRAKNERTAAAERQRMQSEQEALENLRAEEIAEAQRKQARVNTMITNAIDSFDAGNYEAAISYADLALRRSPRNEKALEIRSAAFQAGRKQLNRRYIEERRDEFARWKQYLRALEIPQSNIVTMPDVDSWRKTSELRKGRRGQDLTRAMDPAEAELRERMTSTYVTLPGIQDEDSLGHLVDILRSFSDLPMVVDPAAEDSVASAGVTFTLDFPNRITVRQALDFITTEAGEEVTWTIRHEAIMVTTREKARGKLEVFNHDVQDLVVGLTDFTGPRIDKIRLYDELDADEDGGGPFGGTLEARRVIEIENLSTLIQENVAPESWSDDGVSIESGEGFIVVTHTLEVQQAIRAFLEDLRRLNSTLVTIESKFMTVGDNFIQEIGNDFRGLDGRSLEDLTNGLEDQASVGLDNGGTGSTGQDAAGAPSAGFFYDDGQDGQFAARTGNFFNTALGQSLSTIGGMTFQWNFFNDVEMSTILRAVEKSNRYEVINSQILSVHNTSRAYVAVVNQRAFIQDFSVEVAQFQAVADPEINVL
ncbi:hypothetical protein KDK88_02245, partial [bacterium]|nr:hypothetical protein [bacterium]